VQPVANAAESLIRTPAEFSACVSTGKAIERGFELFREGKFSEALDAMAKLSNRSRPPTSQKQHAATHNICARHTLSLAE